jgi:predicted PurR-regulated permease PerM
VSPTQSDTAARWVTAALVAAAVLIVWPVWPALVLAAWTAALGRPVMQRLERVLRGRRRAASLLTLALVLGLGAPLALVASGVVSGALQLYETALRSPDARAALESIVATQDGDHWRLPGDPAELLELARRWGASSLSLVSGIAGAATRYVIGALLYFAGAYVMLVDGPKAWAWLVARSPLEEAHANRLAAAFHETGRGLLTGVGLTTLTQGIVATVIYLSLGVPRALVLGPMTGLASMVPMVGSSLVWAPLAIGFVVAGHPVKGLVLAALGLAVISTSDNLLRPFFVRLGTLQLPLYVVFVSVFGGLATLGAWGVVMGPLVVRLAVEALSLWRAPKSPDPAP